jgi:hypothetical protein
MEDVDEPISAFPARKEPRIVEHNRRRLLGASDLYFSNGLVSQINYSNSHGSQEVQVPFALKIDRTSKS